MPLNPGPEPYVVLEYHSAEPRVFGVEVRSTSALGAEGVIAGLRWLGASAAFARELTFVVMHLSDAIRPDEIRRIAECANAEGLAHKLGLVARPHPRLGTTVSVLREWGLRPLLGAVGETSRFCDLTRHAIEGVIIDRELVASAAGDPTAASVLDAIVGLASNLGLKTIANDCRSQVDFEFATCAGINYVAYGLRADCQPVFGIRSSSGLLG